MKALLAPGVLIPMLMAAALITGSYFWAKRQSATRDPVRRRTRRPPEARGAHGTSAAAMLKSVLELQAANANWDSILLQLNPGKSSDLNSDLLAIRGPHMFAPATALRVIETGCREALKRNPAASSREALRQARRSMEKVTRFGD